MMAPVRRDVLHNRKVIMMSIMQLWRLATSSRKVTLTAKDTSSSKTAMERDGVITAMASTAFTRMK